MSDEDLHTHVDNYKRWIKQGSKVAVVAHSEGNFYTNFAYDNPQFSEDNHRSLGIVSVANPASYVADGRGLYTTLKEDKMISGVVTWISRGVSLLPLVEVPSPLVANAQNDSYQGTLDNKTGHNFIKSYLNGNQTGPKVIGDVFKLVSMLETPKQVEDNGGVLDTEQGTDTPETHTFDLGKTEGTFQFDYNTENVQDQIIIEYEGQNLFQTSCVGESKSVPIPYKGNSSEITVSVRPNCRGDRGHNGVLQFTVPKSNSSNRLTNY